MEYQCAFESCIPSNQVCNFENNCEGARDELGCGKDN